jgi:hypothetical protein
MHYSACHCGQPRLRSIADGLHALNLHVASVRRALAALLLEHRAFRWHDADSRFTATIS